MLRLWKVFPNLVSSSSSATSRIASWQTNWSARLTPLFTTQRSLTTTTRWPTPNPLFTPTWWVPSACWRRSVSTVPATTTSPPTRSSATSSWTIPLSSLKPPPITPPPRTPPPRQAPTCSYAPGFVPSASRPPSRTARTTTAPTSTSRSSFLARSPTSSRA